MSFSENNHAEERFAGTGCCGSKSSTSRTGCASPEPRIRTCLCQSNVGCLDRPDCGGFRPNGTAETGACPGPCQCEVEDSWNRNVPPKPNCEWVSNFVELRRQWSDHGRREACKCCNCQPSRSSSPCRPCIPNAPSTPSSSSASVCCSKRDSDSSAQPDFCRTHGETSRPGTATRQPSYSPPQSSNPGGKGFSPPAKRDPSGCQSSPNCCCSGGSDRRANQREGERTSSDCNSGASNRTPSQKPAKNPSSCQPCAPQPRPILKKRSCSLVSPSGCMCQPMPRNCHCPPPVQVDARADTECTCDCPSAPECACPPSERRFSRTKVKCSNARLCPPQPRLPPGAPCCCTKCRPCLPPPCDPCSSSQCCPPNPRIKPCTPPESAPSPEPDPTSCSSRTRQRPASSCSSNRGSDSPDRVTSPNPRQATTPFRTTSRSPSRSTGMPSSRGSSCCRASATDLGDGKRPGIIHNDIHSSKDEALTNCSSNRSITRSIPSLSSPDKAVMARDEGTTEMDLDDRQFSSKPPNLLTSRLKKPYHYRDSPSDSQLGCSPSCSRLPPTPSTIQTRALPPSCSEYDSQLDIATQFSLQRGISPPEANSSSIERACETPPALVLDYQNIPEPLVHGRNEDRGPNDENDRKNDPKREEYDRCDDVRKNGQETANKETSTTSLKSNCRKSSVKKDTSTSMEFLQLGRKCNVKDESTQMYWNKNEGKLSHESFADDTTTTHRRYHEKPRIKFKSDEEIGKLGCMDSVRDGFRKCDQTRRYSRTRDDQTSSLQLSAKDSSCSKMSFVLNEEPRDNQIDSLNERSSKGSRRSRNFYEIPSPKKVRYRVFIRRG